MRKSPSSPLSCSTLSEMCIEEYSQLSDSEDSIKGPSYPINQGSLKIQPRDLMASSRISLSSTYEDLEFAFPNKKFLPSMGNHLPRLVIPIGPRFQAKVPKWEGVTNIDQHISDDGLKWLGTQIRPITIISETNTKRNRKR